MSNAGSSLALSLLRHILHEPPGHRLPLLHIYWLVGYVLEFPTHRQWHWGANTGNVAMGAMFIYQNGAVFTAEWSILPYYWITLSLNVILTLMIVVRLTVHARKTRTSMGITGIGRLCNAIVTILIESCALYAVSLSLVIGARTARSPMISFSTPIVPGTQVRASPRSGSSASCLIKIWIGQVIASLLIIQRVANKSAMTSNTVASGHLSSFKSGTGGSDLPVEYPMSSINRRGVSIGELGVGFQNTIDFRQGKVSGPPA